MRCLIFLFFLILLFTIGCKEKNSIKTNNNVSISAEQLYDMKQRGEKLKIIDVRSKKEYFGDMGHIEGSELIPLQTIASSINSLKELDQKIYAVCLSGKRSSIAAKILRDNGIKALNIKGGMMAWNQLKQKNK